MLREKLESSEQQFALMPRPSTTDEVFVQRKQVERYREGQRELHCVLIDLEKAYDRVPKVDSWTCLRLKEVEEKHIRLIQDIWKGSKAYAKCVVGTTDSFKVQVGLQRVFVLSPFLLDVVMDCLTAELQKPAPWDMMFADNVVLNGGRVRKLKKG